MRISAAVLVLHATLATAADTRQVPTFSASAEAVTISVAVPGKHPPLASSDITVYENGREQKLYLFSRNPMPLDIVLLLDVSRSINDTESERMNQLGRRFVEALGENDRMQIMHFGEYASTTQPFTGDRNALRAALHAMRPHNATALRQSIYVALAQLENLPFPPDEPRRRVLVAFTDAVDTRSTMDGELLRGRAHSARTAVYLISIRPSMLTWSALEDRVFAENRFLLSSISKETGGVYFECTSFLDALGTAKRIVTDLASQYTLGWQSDTPSDVTFRHVQVHIRGLTTDKYRYPTGYLVPARR